MSASTTRRPDTRTSTEPRPVRWRGRLIWLLALLVASALAAGAGILVAEQLAGPSTGAPAVHRGPTVDDRELPGKTANGAPSSAAPPARTQPGQEYLWRRAYVRGKLVLIRVRADAANVREDREISK
jgi:hypothetical protein